MAVKIMDPVVIVDPTTWTDALKIGVIMSVIIAFVFIVLYGKASSLVKALALVLAMCAIGGIVLYESEREAHVEDDNASVIMQVYGVKDLRQDGDDRPSGGVWLDPGAGTVTEVHAKWKTKDGRTADGVVKMDATGYRPTAVLIEDR